MANALSRQWEHAVVTGGAGFIGSHLCATLLDAGTAVTCVDDFSTGRRESVSDLLDRPGFTLIQADVAKGFTVGRPPDLLLHLASPASPADYVRLPLHTMDTGSVGTRNALDLAHRSGARFILASTCEATGTRRRTPGTSGYWGHVNAVGPRGVYDEAKRFGEALTTAHADAKGTDTGIVRLFDTYGPRMRGQDGGPCPPSSGRR